MNHNLIDPSISNAGAYQDPNAPFSPNGMDPMMNPHMHPYTTLPEGLFVPIASIAPPGHGVVAPIANHYSAVAPPPLGTLDENGKDGSGDRLEDLIHQLTKPKEPLIQRRLAWRCVSSL